MQIDIIVQGGDFTDILVVRADGNQSLAEALAGVNPAVPIGEEMLVFVEDAQTPTDLVTIIEELVPLSTEEEAIVALKLHVSRCRHVEVSVRFNGEEARRRFSPSATVGRVHHWAARRAFGLSPRDAAEHVLQVRGSHQRPDRDVHVGTLASGAACLVEFDLVPRKRVEG